LDDNGGAQIAQNIIEFQQLTVSSSLKEKELFIKSLLAEKTDDLLDLSKKLIKICKSDWEKHIAPSGAGLIDYIREITGMALEGI